ncbi:NAD(P)-binding domain-containing protein, partial [Nitrosomonas sp.]
MRIAVLGAGAWGSALAISLSARHQISLWSKDPDHAIEMDSQRINHSFLPGYSLPESLKITSTLNEALDTADLALIVVPIV